MADEPITDAASTPLGGQRPLKAALQGQDLKDKHGADRADAIASLDAIEAVVQAEYDKHAAKDLDQFSAKLRSFLGFLLGQCESTEAELRRI